MKATTEHTPRRMLPAALILAGFGLAAACSSAISTPLQASENAPLACEIAADQDGRMIQFQGRLQSNTAISGSYDLTLSGPGTNIRQGGPFRASAGEVVQLGQARLSGNADRYDSELTVTVNGATYRCPATQTDL